MKVIVVFAIFLIMSIVITIWHAEKIKFFGSFEDASKHGSVLDLFDIINLGLEIYLVYLLWDSGYWWVPPALQYIVIGPIIRGIYKI